MTSDLRWPGGKSAAAAFTFDVDAESAVLWGNDAVAARMSVMSHQAYGPLVGLPRILELLDTHQIPATFFVPGHTAHRYPAAVRRIVEAGHEIAHHGYLHEQPTALTLAQEIEALDRGLQALAEVAGVRPVGYRAPMWDLSWRTPELLVERGFLYDSSLMDADHPYELAVGDGSVVEIPIQWALDDWEQYCYLPDIAGSGLIESPRKARELWQLEFDALRAARACWVLTNHPFLSGRASRAAELGDLMRYVVGHDDVWTTNLGAIAEHVRTLHLPPRTITRPGPA
ncbi:MULTISPECIES: polysaccharide deacetylase family protein [Mycobacteriaceae]|uniref:Polysaccharide deacetylase n=1 Tax=Mycolicibacterium parafortuitum TaxID=39692 RepID=A0ACC6MDM5_MYCPF|nr:MULTISPECIES: polysaccharide deacetylase [Mycobacteriaceae]MDZ5085067.1 polysaccharide deacetylase [Mycolicibacterium parafortuitum]GFM20975.1 polysaccharide deacetylase [Mycobacterium sp. PO1]GFM22061.1 polysaccharide deacetylase [Mycobacterium sp. PO2]